MQLIKHITLLMTLAMSSLSVTSFAQAISQSAIAERIAPVGEVYLDGEIAATNQGASSSEPRGPRSGEKIYNTYCVACHGTGAAGAPIKGDTLAWQPRLAQGPEILLQHALSGFNAMPARGNCSDCSDDEMAATVKFLTKGLY